MIDLYGSVRTMFDLCNDHTSPDDLYGSVRTMFELCNDIETRLIFICNVGQCDKRARSLRGHSMNTTVTPYQQDHLGSSRIKEVRGWRICVFKVRTWVPIRAMVYERNSGKWGGTGEEINDTQWLTLILTPNNNYYIITLY